MNTSKGFTLLEVLVALSICAMTGIAAMQATEIMAGVEWFWQQEVMATADKSFVKLTINVFSDEKYEHSIYELSTYLNKGNK